MKLKDFIVNKFERIMYWMEAVSSVEKCYEHKKNTNKSNGDI